MEKESATKCKTEPKRGDKLEFGCIYVACVCLLAPTGALVVMMVYYISGSGSGSNFSDFHSVH